ncbi:MAG: taurine catabolism dioxygenase TauD [Sneathiella sp.]|nr:MAG: taurine catabolism dioxygenase TauD [Sneathiella sp.]
MAFRSFGEQSRYYFDRPHKSMPEGKVISSADWRGADMRARPEDWTYRLTPTDLREIRYAVDHVKADAMDMADLSRETFPLPTLGPKINSWRDAVQNGPGFVLIKGLPVAVWGEEDSTLAYWGLGHYLGIPGAQNPDNELLGHVIDYSEERTNPLVRRYRTAGNIDFHCDAADVVGLLCLHAAKDGGQSRIASSVAIYNEISDRDPALAARLFEPFMIDRRGEENKGQRGYYKRPACCHADGILRTFFHSEYMRSAARFTDGGQFDEITAKTLDLYDELAASDEFHLDMYLEPGDIQFISNHSIVHARTEYQDYPERERKRHLLRLWLSLN